MTTPTTIEDIARLALNGDREALDALVRALQGDIYGLALRMLWNREDAEDATQEILIRIVTRLSQFGFKSQLKTWAYRLAVNYILDVKKSSIERLHLSFERFADDLESGLPPTSAGDSEASLLIEEVKVGCSLAMLQCLDRPHRAVYVLGEIMELSGPEAADVLAISRALLRKRLQHAREAVLAFTKTIAALFPTPRHASVIAGFRRRQLAASARRGQSSSPGGARPSWKLARWSARWTRRAGRSRSIAAASLAPRRWTSPSACSTLLTRRETRRHDHAGLLRLGERTPYGTRVFSY